MHDGGRGCVGERSEGSEIALPLLEFRREGDGWVKRETWNEYQCLENSSILSLSRVSTLIQQSPHTPHRTPTKIRILITLPINIFPVAPTIENLNAEPRLTPRREHSSSDRDTLLCISSSIIRIRPVIMTPSPSRPQPINHFIFQRGSRFIRIGDLQHKYLLWRDGLCEGGKRVVERQLELLLDAASGDQPGRRTRVAVRRAERLERVQTETDVRTIDQLYYFPRGIPGWCMRCPAPVFVG
jgi:hypothetical protein